MQFEAVNPYPPVVFKAHYDGFTDLHIEAAKEILNEAENGGKIWLEEGNARSSVTNQSMPPARHPAFRDFYNWQQKTAGEILINQMKLTDHIPYWVSNSWINVHGLGGLTKTHTHGISVMSIAAYLKMPENGGYIEFRDPLFEMHSIHKKGKQYDVEEYCSVPAVTGDVLFFYGWLHHRTQPNQSNEERWVLTTNYSCVVYGESK